MMIFNTPVWQVLLAAACLPFLVAFAKQKIYKFKVESAHRINLPLDEETNRLHSENKDILDGGKEGKTGEVLAADKVYSILTRLGVRYCSNAGAGYKDAVLPPPKGGDLSSEIDLLVATQFGVYAIEVKHWNGMWSHSDEPGKLTVKYDNGAVYSRNDPLPKTVVKLKRVMSNVNFEVASKPIIVITAPNSGFDYKMDSRYLHIDDLVQFFRQERDQNKHIDGDEFEILKDGVFGCLDTSLTAKHDHMMRLPAAGKVGIYQANHARLAVLQTTPRAAGPQSKPVLRVWLTIAGLLLAGSALAGFKMPSDTIQQQSVKAKSEVKIEKQKNSKKKPPSKNASN